MVQWLGLGTFTSMALGSIPGLGTKILQAERCATPLPPPKKPNPPPQKKNRELAAFYYTLSACYAGKGNVSHFAFVKGWERATGYHWLSF